MKSFYNRIMKELIAAVFIATVAAGCCSLCQKSQNLLAGEAAPVDMITCPAGDIAKLSAIQAYAGGVNFYLFTWDNNSLIWEASAVGTMVTCLENSGLHSGSAVMLWFVFVCEAACTVQWYYSITCIPPAWSIGEWNYCSEKCVATRDVRCANAVGAQIPDNFCPGTRPAATQGCSGGNCGSSGDSASLVSYAETHWNCADAACALPRVSLGDAQPNFPSAEFVSRALVAGKRIDGIMQDAPQIDYAGYTHQCDGSVCEYDLVMMPPRLSTGLVDLLVNLKWISCGTSTSCIHVGSVVVSDSWHHVGIGVGENRTDAHDNAVHEFSGRDFGGIVAIYNPPIQVDSAARGEFATILVALLAGLASW